jgi:tetratricopeptide (TPR) repeat protein
MSACCLGVIEFFLEDYAKANEHFEKFALSMKSSKDDCNKTIERCTESLKSDNDDIKALNERGNAQRDLGNFAAAIEDFNHVLRLKPYDLEAFPGLMFAYMAQKNYASVIQECTKKLVKTRTNKEEQRFATIYLLFRATSLSKIGESKKSLADYCAARRLALSDCSGDIGMSDDFCWCIKTLELKMPTWFKMQAKAIL